MWQFIEAAGRRNDAARWWCGDVELGRPLAPARRATASRQASRRAREREAGPQSKHERSSPQSEHDIVADKQALLLSHGGKRAIRQCILFEE